MFRTVGLVTRKGDAKVRDVLARIEAQLHSRGIAVHYDDVSAELMGSAGTWPDGVETDLVIAVGGDGTMLSAARQHGTRPSTRLLGVNLGRLGFLTDLTPEQLPGGLDRILDGAFIEDRRAFLDCVVERDGAVTASAHALNDVAILKWNSARLISLDTYVDGRFVHTQRSDGVIICTPTGSTAYALSGGGPILAPPLAAIGLVPICPHSLTNRPLVVSDACTVEFGITTPDFDRARLTCDGEDIAALAPGDRVRVCKSTRSVRLIHPASHDHFATLRGKLHWGREPC